MTFANNLDPDEAPQNVGPHLRSKLFATQTYMLVKKNGLKKWKKQNRKRKFNVQRVLPQPSLILVIFVLHFVSRWNVHNFCQLRIYIYQCSYWNMRCPFCVMQFCIYTTLILDGSWTSSKYFWNWNYYSLNNCRDSKINVGMMVRKMCKLRLIIFLLGF